MLFLWLACVLSRIPTVYDPNLSLVGDEAVLGVMARHMLAGISFPVFFYGQHYGFSLFETSAGALSFAFFGTGAVQLRLAMLVFFIAGISFIYLSLTRRLRSTDALLLTLLFLLLPPWRMWSMQARGGYLTAFAASAVITWISLCPPWKKPAARWLAISLLSALVVLAQPLWIPGILPVIGYAAFKERISRRHAILFILLAAAVMLSIRAVGLGLTTNYWHPALFSPERLPGSLPVIPERICRYLGQTLFDEPGTNYADRVTAAGWCIACAACLGLQAWRIARRKFLPWSHVFFFSAVLTAGATTVLPDEPRYLLPLAGCLMLWIGAEISDLLPRFKRGALVFRAACVLLGLLGMAGIVCQHPYLLNKPRENLSADDTIRVFIERLKTMDIRHVYVPSDLLQWKLIFYSDETLYARCKLATDRYPAYGKAIDRATFDGRPTAFVGYSGEFFGLDRDAGQRLFRFGDIPFYFVYRNPEPALLRQLGFELNENQPSQH